MSERFDVVVVGSGAGGGVIAGELAERGRNVLLLETGPHKTAADFTRWESKATHDLWWPIRFALIDGGAGGAVALLGGRCVGGTTTINTKVALRAHAQDYAKWHDASSLVGSSGAAVRRGRPRSPLRPGRATSRRPRAHRLAQERAHRGARVSRARRAARGGSVVHRRELHELRLVPPGMSDECRQVHAQHLHPRCVGGGQARLAGRRSGRAGADRGRRGERRRVRGRRRSRAAGRRGRGRRCGRDAQHPTAAPAVGAAGQPVQPPGRPPSRLPSGAPRLRAVRRAPGRPHGLSDQRALDGAPGRRGRRLRDRGDDDPGSRLVRHDARGRERPSLGSAARRGGAQLPHAGSACSRW